MFGVPTGFVGGAGVLYSVSPWGTTCGIMPDFSWLYDAGFVVSTKPYAFDQDYRTELFDPDEYVVGDESGEGFGAELDERERAVLSGARAILGSRASTTLLALMRNQMSGLEAVGLDDHLFEMLLDYAWQNAGVNVAVCRDVDPAAGRTPSRNPFRAVMYPGDGDAGIVGLITGNNDPPDAFAFPLDWPVAMAWASGESVVLDPVPYTSGDEVTRPIDNISLDLLAVYYQRQLEADGAWETCEGEDSDCEPTPTLKEVLLELAGGLARHGVEAPTTETMKFFTTIRDVWNLNLVLLGPVSKLTFGIATTQINAGLARLAAAITLSATWPVSSEPLNDTASRLLNGYSSILDDVADGLEPWTDTIASILEPFSADVAEGVREIPDAVRDVEEELLVGLDERGMDQLIAALQSDTVSPRADGSAAAAPPLIHLGDRWFTFYFDAFEATYAPAGVNVFPTIPIDPNTSWSEHRSWVERASPMLQFSYCLELAACLIEQLINTRNAFTALSGLVGDEGALGRLARDVLVGMGVDCADEILQRRSFSWLIAQVWKQMMVDALLAAWSESREAGDAEVACVREVFCWMRSSGQRAALDAWLGPPDALEISGFLLRDLTGGRLGSMFTDQAVSLSTMCTRWKEVDCADREAWATLVEFWDCRALTGMGSGGPSHAPLPGEAVSAPGEVELQGWFPEEDGWVDMEEYFQMYGNQPWWLKESRFDPIWPPRRIP